MKIVAVVGARPNFMKIAPIMWEIRRRKNIDAFLVHTGQHYDRQMSEQFFEELQIPRPDIDLGVGSASHAVQTAEVMKRFEPVVNEQRPDLVMVVGDVNSTVACALTSVKLGIPVAHVEAGLRSFDRSMPEEINRIVTDTISRWLFVTEKSGMINLRREGISGDRMFLVGNVMIDTLMASRQSVERSSILQTLQLSERNYAVLTLHRPSNVDDPKALAGLLEVLARLQREMTIVFPVHPRTRAVLETCEIPSGFKPISPLGYLDFMKLVAHSRVVLTDSGGIQEETTVLGVPCLTLRENTERPATIEEGTNVLVGSDPQKIVSAWRTAIDQPKSGRVPELWDGHAAKRIIDVLK
ncbi:MAG TPA: UDP-N-acetylglucosamine 2-epimerase (non-hydrolyzing) [Tepidisphaeraceae bacterium]|nr:UDP-N-acetylglucosamine 2-epimerase (non-hydrolyzing) [Tepidisphaeraceae bacterium]